MTIEKISEEKLKITTEKVEEVNKVDLENRRASLVKDKENVEARIAEVDALLANFTA